MLDEVYCVTFNNAMAITLSYHVCRRCINYTWAQVGILMIDMPHRLNTKSSNCLEARQKNV